ncbi:hypothetical protein GQ457_11G027560 [Hibiscus cannabinus]
MKNILNDTFPKKVDKLLVELGLGRSQEELFTFREGTFDVLDHGNKECIPYSREVESLSRLRTIDVTCILLLLLRLLFPSLVLVSLQEN